MAAGSNCRRKNNMGLLSSLRRVLYKAIDKSYEVGQLHGEKKKIKDPRRAELVNSVVLTNEQKASIDKLYAKVSGGTVDYSWHRLYQSFTGNFDAAYFPEWILSSKLEPLFNAREYRYVLDDKLLLPLFCNGVDGVRTPKTIGCFCHEVFFDQNRDTYSLESFCELLSNSGICIIKPVQDTSSGRGVRMLHFVDGIDTKSGETVESIIEQYRKGAFLIQEAVDEHECLKQIYPGSVNTFRVVTYLWNGKVNHWPIALRIGQGGSYLDNAHAGGMFIGVDDEGNLQSRAFTEFRNVFEEHPDTKYVFKGKKLPLIPELIDKVTRMHLNAPELGLISWDFTIDSNGIFVLIEVNTTGQSIWFPQMANGKGAFGENTSAVIQYISE